MGIFVPSILKGFSSASVGLPISRSHYELERSTTIFGAIPRGNVIGNRALALSVKHSTISRLIKAFEESLGSRLFERLPEGFVLTQVGESLLEHTLIMEEQA
jgi:hypothetical protein